MSENRLAFEKSPYLLQHAQNPVDWFPWGEEAFSLARATNRPVFLSVGYSTCHWCHVMAHESFENPEIARLLNTLFVNVKVDREERPDVDRVYMSFVQATTGVGGWPMSVWLTPQGEPFFGGTYFPPGDRQGRPSFLRVLQAIDNLWKNESERVIEQGEATFAALRKEIPRQSMVEGDYSIVTLALNQFALAFDRENGGFGKHPKFPRPSTFEFLLRCSEQDENARHMCLFSLRKIALGGICDHLGGGFHRYSVDPFWHVPHFEKMLYDQAQLALVFTEAFQISDDPLFAQAALHTLEYVARDLSQIDGGFYSAEDADSEVLNGEGRRAEGAFYVWKSSEILDLLGTDLGDLFCKAYGIHQCGNAPESGDPHGEFKGWNILARNRTPQDFAKEIGQPMETIEELLSKARRRLFLERNKRPRPHLDDKILSAWNGLAISAFARAGSVFQKESLLKRAAQAAHFLHTQMWKDGKLVRSWRQGPSSIAGFAADYALLIQGLLDLYEADFRPEWLIWTLELQAVLDHEFWDEIGGSYFESVPGESHLPLTIKDRYDGVEPAANSVCALNLLRLSRMFRNSQFEERAKRILSDFSEKKIPTALPYLLSALLFQKGPSEELVIAGPRESPQTRAFARAVHGRFRPNSVLLLADEGIGSEVLSRTNPLFREMRPVNGQPALYICKEYACQAPIVDPEML